MNTQKISLLLVIIILFAIGAWPIALVLLIFYIIKPLSKKPNNEEKQAEQRIQELEAENEKLQAELDQQLVQRVMDKVENRGEGR